MAEAKADDVVAATLAAALIQAAGRSALEASKKKPAEFAAEIYFQCVDAVADAKKKRTKTSVKSFP